MSEAWLAGYLLPEYSSKTSIEIYIEIQSPSLKYSHSLVILLSRFMYHLICEHWKNFRSFRPLCTISQSYGFETCAKTNLEIPLLQ
jgi:hypothetical protein